jgi:hypothetical protein
MNLSDLRQRHIGLIHNTLITIGNVLKPVSQAQSVTMRDAKDGLKGWSILEIVCHLRDFDVIFAQRANKILTMPQTLLPAYDHEALVIEHAYHTQILAQVYSDLVRSRLAFIEFFRGLNDDEWERCGIHPERGNFSLTDSLVQVGTHDCVHIEQITRILAQ